MSLKSIAKQIIDKTASIVAPNTVNLMDEKGIIIASSDEKRVGTFHSGAFMAIKEKREVHIYPEEVEKFEGVKQGVNIPIIKKGKAIAVIGIFGNPDEIKQTARLLSISTSLFLDQAEYSKKEQRRLALRSNLNEIIYSKNCLNEFFDVVDALAISITFPIQAILFSFRDTSLTYEKVVQILKTEGSINRNTDILLVYPSYFLLLKSDSNKTIKKEAFIKAISKYNLKKLAFSPTILKIDDLNDSLRITKALLSLPYERISYNGNNFDDLVLLAFDTNSRDYLTPYIESMKTKIDKADSFWIYPTLKAYVIYNGKIQSIANSLNIHKNTCIYRVNKLLELINLENCNSFTISYFFRAIIHSTKSTKVDIL